MTCSKGRPLWRTAQAVSSGTVSGHTSSKTAQSFGRRFRRGEGLEPNSPHVAAKDYGGKNCGKREARRSPNDWSPAKLICRPYILRILDEALGAELHVANRDARFVPASRAVAEQPDFALAHSITSAQDQVTAARLWHGP
jgi:hypothetical protein